MTFIIRIYIIIIYILFITEEFCDGVLHCFKHILYVIQLVYRGASVNAGINANVG